jgi:hypothetical protein
MREHARLAAAGTGQYEHGSDRRRHSFALRVVERIEDGRNVHGDGMVVTIEKRVAILERINGSA